MVPVKHTPNEIRIDPVRSRLFFPEQEKINYRKKLIAQNV